MRTFDLLLRLLRLKGDSPGQEKLASAVRPYVLAPFLEFALNRSTQESQSGQSEEEGRQVKLVSTLSRTYGKIWSADQVRLLDMPIPHGSARRGSAHVSSDFHSRRRLTRQRPQARRSRWPQRGHASRYTRVRISAFQVPRGERIVCSSCANVTSHIHSHGPVPTPPCENRR